MNSTLKHYIKAIVPPIVITAAKTAMRQKRMESSNQSNADSGQKEADWYDSSFENNDRWREHYTRSGYYFLWTVIVDRMLRAGTTSVLEVACGAGQLACMLRDNGIDRYHGFDFSPKRLEQARVVCPEYEFSVEDAFSTEIFETFDYDAALSTEFLEHVEGDLEALSRIRPGTKFYGTVPNFPFVSHVRHFNNAQEVEERYSKCFSELRVDTILANDKGKQFFLLEGIIASA